MIKLITYLILLFCSVTIFTLPYFSALAYVLASLIQPQYLWNWVFINIPIFKITAGMAIIAWLVAVFKGSINWSVYRSGIVYSLLIMLILFYMSDFLSPFQVYYSAVSSDLVIGVFTTIVIMFCIIIGSINNEKALLYGLFVLLFVVLYYAYWANSAYFGGEWFRFQNGRLTGPPRSPYRDGNVASVLFVIAIPFLVLAFYEIKKIWIRVAIALALVFMLHSIILFASRGALVSIAIAMIVTAFMVRSKLFNIALVMGMAVFIYDQGNQLVSRTTSTVQTAQTNQSEPINPRIVSWQVGLELTKKHPIFGVGPQRFLQASRTYFPGKSNHVAHNTFLNFSANTGIITGLLYLLFFWFTFKYYRLNSSILKKAPNELLSYVNQASFVSMIGFFIAALFLDLIIFEPFYFLLAIVVVTHQLTKKHGVSYAEQAQ